MDLYDRIGNQHADPQTDSPRPRKWIGSGQANCISHIDISPQSFTIEGVDMAIAEQPIRVEQIADDLHIVHVGLLVEQIHHDPRVHVEREHTYSLPRQATRANTAPSWDTLQQFLADILDTLRTSREEAQQRTAEAKADADAARAALKKIRTENS